eukprot:1010804_1
MVVVCDHTRIMHDTEPAIAQTQDHEHEGPHKTRTRICCVFHTTNTRFRLQIPRDMSDKLSLCMCFLDYGELCAEQMIRDSPAFIGDATMQGCYVSVSFDIYVDEKSVFIENT